MLITNKIFARYIKW